MLPIVLFANVISAIPHLNIERVCRPAGVDNSKDEHTICVASEQTALTTLRQKWRNTRPESAMNAPM
jgi:hypothetical protein